MYSIQYCRTVMSVGDRRGRSAMFCFKSTNPCESDVSVCNIFDQGLASPAKSYSQTAERFQCMWHCNNFFCGRVVTTIANEMFLIHISRLVICWYVLSFYFTNQMFKRRLLQWFLAQFILAVSISPVHCVSSFTVYLLGMLGRKCSTIYSDYLFIS